MGVNNVTPKYGVNLTPVGAVLSEHHIGVKINTGSVPFDTTVFMVFAV